MGNTKIKKNNKKISINKKTVEKNINSIVCRTKNSKRESDNKKKLFKVKNNTITFYSVILVISFLFAIGISYSFFSYIRSGNPNSISVGKIFFNYNTSQTLLLSKIEPRSDLDSNTYIEFTVDGINEYTKDIWYAVDLLYGDVPDGKREENRIRDGLLRFTLKRFINNDEEVLLENQGYDSIQDLRMYVDTISAGTNEQITYVYRLYMWISDEINVGNGVDADYTANEWNNLFASVKVKITGDFEEKGITNTIKVNFDANGGSVNKLYKYYNEGDTYGELPIPVREDYIFNGWYYANKKILSTDIVSEDGSAYVNNEDIVLDGTNYIDTGMYIFNESNWQRNFLLSFRIKSKENTQVNQATLINAKLEIENRGYPGFLFRKNSSNYEISANKNDVATSKKITDIPLNTEKVTIIRINNMLYYQIDDGDFLSVLDYTGFTNYFDVPLTIGASLDGNGKPQRYFKGIITDFIAQYLDDDATLENYQDHLYYSSGDGITLKASWIKNGVHYDGEYEFDGTTYIDTGIYLFNEENWQKDFYMSFEILENNSTDTMATPMSAKNENGTPYPGVEFRLAGNLNNYRSKAAKSTASNGSKDITNIPVSTTHKAQYLRIDNILYYNIDSKTNGKFVKMLDFSDFKLFFDVPVTFGASLTRPGGIPQRFFIGKLANMVVKFIPDNEVEEYRSMLPS